MSGTLGHPRLHLRVTDSTNARARALALAGAPHGTLVTAAEQTAGRGRQGRRWSAPAGSALLASLVLRTAPRARAPLPTLLPLVAAVAVCEIAGEEARVKWPNDIVIEHEGSSGRAGALRDPSVLRDPGALRDPSALQDPGAPGHPAGLAKLAGILTEGRPQEGWAVLGIGLNVAVNVEDLPTELRARAATMGLAPSAIEPTLARLLDALGRWLSEPTQTMLDAYRTRDALHGRAIEWGAPQGDAGRPERGRAGQGRAQGVDGEGRLVVALANGGHTTLAAGEVHLRAS